MKNRTPELFDLIEAYLENNLSPQAKLDFEEQLAANEALKAEVEKHRMLKEVVADGESMAFREKLRSAEQEYTKSIPKERSKPVWLSWKIAAGIAALIGLGLFFLFSTNTSKDALFEQYFRPYPAEDVVRGEKSNPVQEAISYYAKGDFTKAIPELKKIIATFPQSKMQERLYLGSAYLATDQLEKAIAVFRELANTPTLNEQAKWYLALGHLKLGELETAKALLQELVVYDGIYKTDAQQLLSDF